MAGTKSRQLCCQHLRSLRFLAVQTRANRDNFDFQWYPRECQNRGNRTAKIRVVFFPSSASLEGI
eukprot:4130384-Amphidinium_carterae.1